MVNWFCHTLDTLLDQTVVFSYTNLGYTLRHWSWDPTDVDVDMSGKICIVTGANSGLVSALLLLGQLS